MNIEFLTKFGFGSAATLTSKVVSLSGFAALPLPIFSSVMVRTSAPSVIFLAGMGKRLFDGEFLTPGKFVSFCRLFSSAFSVLLGHMNFLASMSRSRFFGSGSIFDRISSPSIDAFHCFRLGAPQYAVGL